jgi:hypothetical protein
VRAGLVGDDVDLLAAGQQLGQHLGGVGDHADRQRPSGGGCGAHPAQAVLDGVGDLVEVAGLDPPLHPDGSTSRHSAVPPFMVTASGCAPPIPPSPAVRTTLPRSVPSYRWSARAAKVWKVPCTMPWVPM